MGIHWRVLKSNIIGYSEKGSEEGKFMSACFKKQENTSGKIKQQLTRYMALRSPTAIRSSSWLFSREMAVSLGE